MALRPAAPCPAGETCNLVDPPNQMPQNIALYTTLLTAVTLLLVMRVYTRIRISKVKLGLEDYFCIASYVLNFGFTGLMFKAYSLGVGRHIWNEPAEWVFEAIKFQTIAGWVYIILSLSIKLTFFFYYRRIFSPRTKKRFLIDAGIIFSTLFSIGLFFGGIFNCNPIGKIWNPRLPGRCLTVGPLAFLTGALNVVTDIYILILPIPFLWSLNMQYSRKIRIYAIFAIGIFVCAASIVRLAMTQYLRVNPDLTWNFNTVAIFTALEVNLGIICSCLMVLPAFVDRHLPTTIKTFPSRIWGYAISISPLLSRKGSKSSMGGRSQPRPSSQESYILAIHSHESIPPIPKISRDSGSR
ncbi:hypothetical protein F5883DRAFT_531921 [Diaporthe sp. PMI_573]|nr:hypothetical protein F5883DRAFT_531921 [Diaporthaceae sp. PMI_573]